MSTLALSFINNTPGSRRPRAKRWERADPRATPNLSRFGPRHRRPRSLSVSQTDAFLLGRRGWRAVSVLPFLGRCAISACTSPPWPVEKSCHSLASLWHSYWLDPDPLRSAPLIILSQISFHGKNEYTYHSREHVCYSFKVRIWGSQSELCNSWNNIRLFGMWLWD